MKTAIKANAEKRSFAETVKKRSALYIMLIPGILYLILFNYLPMFGMILSFKKINFRDGILGSAWCGLDNFRYALSSPSLITALKNTILYNIVILFVGLALSILLAIMLDLLWGKLSKKVYQTIMIMPHFLSWVIASYLVFGFLSIETGVINNSILPILGMDKINWYMEAKYWPAILIIVYFWKEWGYSSILYTSALAGVDVQLYEAADIDGASIPQKLWNITLPSIKPIISMMLILKVGGILTTDMGLFYQIPLNTPQLYNTTNVISTYTYNLMTGSGANTLGMAAATSMLNSLVGFVLIVISNGIVKKLDTDGGVF
ncbi:MAG: sugar ABC transporter permease [Clostridiales bacterium]|nr:sugar ABC transporter permease [Clostridiales bacterium]